jgi:tetratricopeptide (TPR) repeat protein
MLIRAGRGEEAEKVATEVLEADGTQTQAWTVIARSRKERGLLDGAAQAYRSAREADPEAWGPLFLLASLEEERSQLEKALAVSDEAVEAFPDQPDLALQRVRLLWKCDRHEDAALTFLDTHEKHRRAARRFLAREDELAELKKDERVAEALAAGKVPGGAGEEN